jgi:hypothetical protein
MINGATEFIYPWVPKDGCHDYMYGISIMMQLLFMTERSQLARCWGEISAFETKTGFILILSCVRQTI